MPERDCTKCTRQAMWGCTARFNGKPGQEPLRKLWDNPADLPVAIGGMETYACPRQSMHENPKDWAQLFRLYGMYRRGFLPNRGAIADQSNALTTAFTILDAANAEADKAIAEREQAKRNRDAKAQAVRGHRGRRGR